MTGGLGAFSASLVLGEDHAGAAEAIVFQGDLVVDRDVVLDLDVVADDYPITDVDVVRLTDRSTG
jgi:hypothetical protein